MSLAIEVVYAGPDEQAIVTLTVPHGTTAGEAIERSGLLERFPDLGPAPTFGIFGKTVSAAAPVAAGDRVELYRPLVADPKQARRRRAASGRRA